MLLQELQLLFWQLKFEYEINASVLSVFIMCFKDMLFDLSSSGRLFHMVGISYEILPLMPWIMMLFG